MDERFLIHRLKSTSLAAVVGSLSMGTWFLYEQIVNRVIHWHIIIFMGIIAVTKLSAMLYYRLTN